MQNIKASALLKCIKTNKHKYIISIVWLLGLVIGKYCAQSHPWDSINANMISNSFLSYPRGLLLVIFTMLIGCLSCVVSSHLLYIFLFLKACGYALVATNISIAFGSAGWLLRLLLLSTDTLLILAILLFSFKSAGKRFDIIMRNIAVVTVVMTVLISVDIYFISPLTASLLNR